MFAWLAVYYTFTVVAVQSRRDASDQHPFPLLPPFPVDSKPYYGGVSSTFTETCASLPNGWMIPNGHCQRFFMVCVNGIGKPTDCYQIVQTTYPNIFNPADWVFDETRKRCTRRTRCSESGSPALAMPAPSLLPTTTTATLFAVPEKCAPGVIYPIGRCNNTFVQCSPRGIPVSFSCPSNFLFDSSVMACLSVVAGCPRPSTPTLRMLEDVERAWDEERNAVAERTNRVEEKQYPSVSQPISAFYKHVDLSHAGRQPVQDTFSAYSHPWYMRPRADTPRFNTFVPSHFRRLQQQYGVFDAFNGQHF
ncbi:hypothetical protein Tcan_08674 [Toxocara canis]|uniref:Chitin-binding type-2 domain-containing protein n=1 Tax=Toxocara canis TaxID=6265 RepID=A0A0B2VYE9_TOXCA|nr:hypothetical protein Tcan_08674 [Toxocara canis]